MLTVLSLLAPLWIGVMVGVEFAVAVFVNPALARLPMESSLEVESRLGRVLGRVMPFWYISSLLLIAGLAVLQWGTSSAVLLIIAAGLFAASVVMSVTLLVPINNRSQTWTLESHPDDWREQRARWHVLHYGRVALIVAGFALTVAAIVLG